MNEKRKPTDFQLGRIVYGWHAVSKKEASSMAAEILELRKLGASLAAEYETRKGREMPKVIEIRDGHGDRNLEIWTDLTKEEVDAVPGIDEAYCAYGGSSHMSVYIDPRWTKDFVIDALTQAANAKAAQE